MSSRSVVDQQREPLFDQDEAPGCAWPPPLVSIDRAGVERIEGWGAADEAIAHHCRLKLSGTLRIDSEPIVRIYLHEGLVYFAERSSDPELGLRLVLDGVVTDEQLVRGSRLLERGRQLGRLFENDATIDSVRVVEAVRRYCGEALGGIDGRGISAHAFLVDEHHSSGILAWYTAPAVSEPTCGPAGEGVVVEEAVPAHAAGWVEAAVPVETVRDSVIELESEVIDPGWIEAVVGSDTAFECEPIVDLEPVDDLATPLGAGEAVVPATGSSEGQPARTPDHGLDPVELVPLVEGEEAPAALEHTHGGLPRRHARADEHVLNATAAGLGERQISALRAAITTMRAAAVTAPAGALDEADVLPTEIGEVANEAVPGSPAERRRWLARRRR